MSLILIIFAKLHTSIKPLIEPSKAREARLSLLYVIDSLSIRPLAQYMLAMYRSPLYMLLSQSPYREEEYIYVYFFSLTIKLTYTDFRNLDTSIVGKFIISLGINYVSFPILYCGQTAKLPFYRLNMRNMINLYKIKYVLLIIACARHSILSKVLGIVIDHTC